MNIFLIILICLTTLSLILKRRVITILTCALILFAVFDREETIAIRARDGAYLKEALKDGRIEGAKESFGFSQGVTAIILYTRDTESFLHIYSLLILLLIAAGTRKAERKKEKSNQQVDPIVTTPADKVEAQSTQGHP